jgi:hypothetical protein
MNAWRVEAPELPFVRTLRERIAARQVAQRKASELPSGYGMTWSQYKAMMERDEAARKLELVGKPKKRRAGPGCRYKPAAPKWKPAARDVDTTFRGSSWSA